MNDSCYYYRIIIAYEVPCNILDSDNPEKIMAKQKLYETLTDLVPGEQYEKFSSKLVMNQLKDTLNYLITYEAYFRSLTGLPMEEWVEANELKKRAEKEMEAYFNALDCDYKQINIKALL